MDGGAVAAARPWRRFARTGGRVPPFGAWNHLGGLFFRWTDDPRTHPEVNEAERVPPESSDANRSGEGVLGAILARVRYGCSGSSTFVERLVVLHPRLPTYLKEVRGIHAERTRSNQRWPGAAFLADRRRRPYALAPQTGASERPVDSRRGGPAARCDLPPGFANRTAMVARFAGFANPDQANCGAR